MTNRTVIFIQFPSTLRHPISTQAEWRKERADIAGRDLLRFTLDLTFGADRTWARCGLRALRRRRALHIGATRARARWAFATRTLSARTAVNDNRLRLRHGRLQHVFAQVGNRRAFGFEHIEAHIRTRRARRNTGLQHILTQVGTFYSRTTLSAPRRMRLKPFRARFDEIHQTCAQSRTEQKRNEQNYDCVPNCVRRRHSSPIHRGRFLLFPSSPFGRRAPTRFGERGIRRTLESRTDHLRMAAPREIFTHRGCRGYTPEITRLKSS